MSSVSRTCRLVLFVQKCEQLEREDDQVGSNHPSTKSKGASATEGGKKRGGGARGVLHETQPSSLGRRVAPPSTLRCAPSLRRRARRLSNARPRQATAACAALRIGLFTISTQDGLHIRQFRYRGIKRGWGAKDPTPSKKV